MLTLDFALARFTANLEVFTALGHVADEQARWKPAPEAWSVLEVFGHLYDEEREDFRQRVRLTLETPAADWPAIHPSEWVTERTYNQQEWPAKLVAFVAERQNSLAWLKNLSNPNWESRHTHPQFGSATAGEMLSAWVAHDHLHIRQLNELHWHWLARTAPAEALQYAGGW